MNKHPLTYHNQASCSYQSLNPMMRRSLSPSLCGGNTFSSVIAIHSQYTDHLSCQMTQRCPQFVSCPQRTQMQSKRLCVYIIYKIRKTANWYKSCKHNSTSLRYQFYALDEEVCVRTPVNIKRVCISYSPSESQDCSKLVLYGTTLVCLHVGWSNCQGSRVYSQST